MKKALIVKFAVAVVVVMSASSWAQEEAQPSLNDAAVTESTLVQGEVPPEPAMMDVSIGAPCGCNQPMMAQSTTCQPAAATCCNCPAPRKTFARLGNRRARTNTCCPAPECSTCANVTPECTTCAAAAPGCSTCGVATSGCSTCGVAAAGCSTCGVATSGCSTCGVATTGCSTCGDTGMIATVGYNEIVPAPTPANPVSIVTTAPAPTYVQPTAGSNCCGDQGVSYTASTCCQPTRTRFLGRVFRRR